MSHGVHNHGHHYGHGHHHAQGASGEKKSPAAASTPAAQAQPTMDNAMAQLDQAIQSLAANFHKDSFNGQQAPAGVEAAPSTLTNSVGGRNEDMFLGNAGAAPAPAAQAPADPTTSLRDPLLDIRGGGALGGGVLAGGGSYLGQSGGGALPGGVLPSRS